jgi:hypothetical protein
MSVAKGQELDKYLTMYSDFFSNSIDFMVKNIDKVLMMTIICFLLMSWTIIFEWEFPKNKNVILKKTFQLGNKVINVDKNAGKIKETFIPRDEVLMDCGNDQICKNNQKCNNILDSYECSLADNCCLIKENADNKCVGGSKDGPTYNINKVDEWWYLGKKFN